MADKEAIVYIVDQGASTGECHNGRIETDLDYAMRYVWGKIAITMSANRKTWTVGVVGFRTTITNIPFDDEEGYENISVMKGLGFMEISHLRDLQKSIKPSTTDAGDAVSAIVVATEMINKFTTNAKGAPLKYTRKIVLVTDGQGQMDFTDIDEIANQINKSGIQLVVVGVDFDDAEFGFKEEDKGLVKSENEALLKSLTEKCSNGIFGTVAEAIEDLSVPRPKITRYYKSYEGQLTLGDPTKYDTAIRIDVERYFKTKAARPPTASSVITRSDMANGEASAQSSHTLPGDTEIPDPLSAVDGLSAVRRAITYRVNDATAPGGKKDVERDELAKGYLYGSTAVHIAESDENVTKLETTQGFTIIGFIPMDKYERFLNMGESSIIIAQKTNDKARMALSSLIRALHELESYAVARIVMKDSKDPQILLLAPSIEPELEALIDVPLPFAEDVRAYRFPPLDRVISTSGATLSKHRNLPTDDLIGAMSDYVDSMDLSTFGRNNEGQPTEYMTIDETFSPVLHRVNQAICRRAVQPDEAVIPPADVLMKWSNPPPELVSESALQLQTLVTAASVKKVLPKAKGKRFRRETIKPLSGLDVDSLLAREKRQKISVENTVPEFKQMLATGYSGNNVSDAAKQISEIILSLITKSVGDSGYAQAMENMRVMREELIEFEEPEIYNDFMRDLKQRVVKDELGGDRREFWFDATRSNKLGLIDSSTTEFSDVTEKEAKEFMFLTSDLPSRPR